MEVGKKNDKITKYIGRAAFVNNLPTPPYPCYIHFAAASHVLGE